jgi:peptidylprolyl isomerase
MRRTALAVTALLLPLLLVAAACGSDSSNTNTSPNANALDAITVDGEIGSAPTVTFSQPFKVDKTVSKVITAGTGETLQQGATVGFDYAAINGRDGKQFDASYDAGPVSGVLDEREILPGLVKGLVGANVGSRVLIALAPADAFGPRGGATEVGIEKDDTVLFVVDVREVRHPLERATGTPVAPVAGQPTVSLDDSGKPTITLPGGDPPTQLVVQPLIQGDGADVQAGQTVSVHYTGVIWGSGKQFDSSWDRGTPAAFPIGSGSVIAGWDTGLVGQKVGTQLLLIVPPDQGYGSNGSASAGISGTDTLVFVVDILDTY